MTGEAEYAEDYAVIKAALEAAVKVPFGEYIRKLKEIDEEIPMMAEKHDNPTMALMHLRGYKEGILERLGKGYGE